MDQNFEIFLVATPGLENALLAEALELGLPEPRLVQGGVAFDGDWEAVWRANLQLRGATRVLARVGSFMAFHLAQLDKRARKFPWADILRPDVPVRVEVSTSRKSKIYHAGAATQRIETALREAHGITIALQSGFEAYVPKTRVVLFEAGMAAAYGLPRDVALAAITIADYPWSTPQTMTRSLIEMAVGGPD